MERERNPGNGRHPAKRNPDCALLHPGCKRHVLMSHEIIDFSGQGPYLSATMKRAFATTGTTTTTRIGGPEGWRVP